MPPEAQRFLNRQLKIMFLAFGVALAVGVELVDGRGWRRGLGPAMLLGRHALTAFVAAHLLSDLAIRVVRWPDPSLHHFIQRRLLASWLPAGLASLVHVGGGGRIYRSDGSGVILRLCGSKKHKCQEGHSAEDCPLKD